MKSRERKLLSGNEAIALAALQSGVALGTGYPGTPSTEILENFSALGGRAQWAPNEKVALEVGIGAAFAGARVLVTMKHVGVNVAADPLFTAVYTGVQGALVLVSADDPGLASSQNEQDNRHYSRAAGIPTLEPCDSQQAYDFLALAIELSERWRTPIMLRVTTRVCHSKTVVEPRELSGPKAPPMYVRDVPGRVMIPAYARQAHRRLREKLAAIAAWNESSGPNRESPGGRELGIIASGISVVHAREAAPEASVFQVGMSYPLPIERLRTFVASVKRCVVVEEGDPVLVESLRAAGISVEGKAEMYRFGELNVNRVRRLLANNTSPEPAPPKGKPPELCQGCPHRLAFGLLRKLDCIVAGDIGCYTLGVLPPFQAMDTCVCMGASITVGLGLRHVLSETEGRRVVSVIGDSTFVHSGITGLVEMLYNPPPTGHLVIILDNSTTAMTGLQEHPGTGKRLNHEPTNRIVFEDLIRSLGIKNVDVVDPGRDEAAFEKLIRDRLAASELSVVIVRRPCILAFKRNRELERAAKGEASHG